MLDKNFYTIKEVMKHCSDIRRSGSCALDIAWTACGRVEAYLERRVKLWDYAAGKVILEELAVYYVIIVDIQLKTN